MPKQILLTLSAFLAVIASLAQVKPLIHAHAHNDYEHEHPFYDAIGYGFTSVEADIYLIGKELYVSHNIPQSLKGITLKELYLQPLQNRLASHKGKVYDQFEGIFYLMIDIKSAAEATYQVLREQLMHYPELLHNPHICIFISGNRNTAQIVADTANIMAIDGRPNQLGLHFSNTIMPIISESFQQYSAWNGIGTMLEKDQQVIQQLAQKAHEEGKKLRLWAIPDNANCWATLLQLGVDFINTDQLSALSEFFAKQNH